MKYLIFAAALVFGGCSTPQKQADSTSTNSASQATQAIVRPPQPGPAPGMIKADYDGDKLACSKGRESRMLEILKKASGCELKYTKAGRSSFISSSARGKKHCESSKAKLREKLEKAGFLCNPA